MTKHFCEIFVKKPNHINYVKSNDRLSQVLVENLTTSFKINLLKNHYKIRNNDKTFFVRFLCEEKKVF